MEQAEAETQSEEKKMSDICYGEPKWKRIYQNKLHKQWIVIAIYQ